MRRCLTASPEVRSLVAEIGDAADRITVIVRDLSSLAKPVDDPVGPIELRGVVESAARLAAYRMGTNVTLVRDSLEVPAVVGTASRLVQVILNLLIDAARATKLDTPNTIRVGAVASADLVVVSISDTGTGMSNETKARIFEPFYTTGSESGGAGLGLVLSRRANGRDDRHLEHLRHGHHGRGHAAAGLIPARSECLVGAVVSARSGTASPSATRS